MAGILRNLLTILIALFQRQRCAVQSTVSAHFWVMPWDAGIKVLKSDKYLTLAEAAQLDFLIKTKLMGSLLVQRMAFINGAQMVRFVKSVGMFSRVEVKSRVMFADDKWAYFEHIFFVNDILHAQVWVKMKFKQGRITVNPVLLLGAFELDKPPFLQHWDDALATPKIERP